MKNMLTLFCLTLLFTIFVFAQEFAQEVAKPEKKEGWYQEGWCQPWPQCAAPPPIEWMWEVAKPDKKDWGWPFRMCTPEVAKPEKKEASVFAKCSPEVAKPEKKEGMLPLRTSGAHYTMPNVICAGGLEVNTYTGNLFFPPPDYYLPARGVDIDFTLSYNSGETKFDYGYGAGWTHTFNVVYEKIGSDISVKRWDGNRDTFKFAGAAYTPPTGCHDSLTQYLTGKFRLRTKYGVEFFFDDSTYKKVTSIRDRNGNIIIVSYSCGRPVRITDPNGRHVSLAWAGARMVQFQDSNSVPAKIFSYQYDSDGNLVRTTDPLGNVISYAYDHAKRLIVMTDAQGGHFVVTYDDSGAVREIKSSLLDETFSYDVGSKTTTHTIGGHSTTYTFDVSKRVIEIAGSCCCFHRQFQYDSDNNITSLTDANGHVTTYTYDTRGNCLTVKDALNHTATYTYDPVYNNVTSVTDRRGNTTSFTYDSKGNLTDISKPLGITESYAYDSYGNVTSYTDGQGHSTTYTYDGNGYLTDITHPIGAEHFAYDNSGNVLSYTDPNGNISSYTYDGMNRLISAQNALSDITTYTYNANGDVASATYPNGNVLNYTYDAIGRVVQVNDGIGRWISNSYDAAGNLVASTDGNSNTSIYAYDSQNRLISESRGGITETYTYDAAGNLLTSTDGNGHTITYDYDVLNRITTFASEGVTSGMFTYDNNGNVRWALDGNMNTTIFSYDALDRLTMETFPDASTIQYTYDGDNNVVSRTDNNGAVTSYTYDSNDRLTKRDFPGSIDDTYTYDAGGRWLTATNNDASITRTYDVVDRVLTETMNGHTTSYSYNTAARQRTITWSGHVVQETRDIRGNLVSISGSGLNIHYSYDPGSRLSTVSYGGSVSTAYSYNSRDLATAITHTKGSTTLVGEEYQYDNADNCTIARNIRDSSRSELYGYNGLNWLTSFRRGTLVGGEIPTPSYMSQYYYDHAGNWDHVVDTVWTGYTSNGLNQYTSCSPGGSFTYDPNGNIRANRFHGTYDYENRLVYGNDTAVHTQGYYKYDAFGRRVQKVTGSDTINYYYDGSRVIDEWNNHLELVMYVYGGQRIDDLLGMMNGNWYIYLKDAQGSVVGLLNDTSTMGSANRRSGIAPTLSGAQALSLAIATCSPVESGTLRSVCTTIVHGTMIQHLDGSFNEIRSVYGAMHQMWVTVTPTLQIIRSMVTIHLV